MNGAKHLDNSVWAILKNTTVWGGGELCPPPPSNFDVSIAIAIKFGVLIEFDTFPSKYPECFENNVNTEL